MSIPIGFDTIEEIANLALFTRRRQKKAFHRGIINEKNRVETLKVNPNGVGYFETNSRTGRLTKVKNMGETAKGYPQLIGEGKNESPSSGVIRKRYLEAVAGPGSGAGTLNTLDRSGGWDQLANKGFITSGDGARNLIHSRGAAAYVARTLKLAR